MRLQLETGAAKDGTFRMRSPMHSFFNTLLHPLKPREKVSFAWRILELCFCLMTLDQFLSFDSKNEGLQMILLNHRNSCLHIPCGVFYKRKDNTKFYLHVFGFFFFARVLL